jgi:hypothetical protein
MKTVLLIIQKKKKKLKWGEENLERGEGGRINKINGKDKKKKIILCLKNLVW